MRAHEPRVAAVATRLDRFLFAPVEPRSAVVLRLLLGLALALAFWPEGRAPLGWIARSPDARALWEGVFLAPAWRAAALASIALFAAGLGGRASGACAVALLLPLAFARGAVSRQILLLSLLAFSLLRVPPLGARAQAAPTPGPIWPLRLLQIQLTAVYGVNAWAKLTPEYLRGDVLVELSRVMPNFLVDLSGGSLSLGPLAVPAWLCAVGTVAIEAALAVGFWIPRLRWATAALGVCFHVGLSWVLTIGHLDQACVLLYAAFLLPLEAQRGRDAPPRSPDCGSGARPRARPTRRTPSR